MFTLASFRVVILEVPVERLADVADAAGDLFLAGAERARGHDVAASELEKVLRHSGRVAVALLAQRVVVPLWRALIALGNDLNKIKNEVSSLKITHLVAKKVVKACADPIVIASNASRAGCVTIACFKC